MKATAIAPSNIAFIKYWGKKDEKLRLPENGSISMNLSGLSTTCTVEFNRDGEKDEIDHERIKLHIDRVRKLAGMKDHARVDTRSNFPHSTGLSASASVFAALTLAATKAAGLDLSEKELSILARQGSGSACRSIPDGFAEWLDGNTSDTSYAVSIYPPQYWDLVDIVAVVTHTKKRVSTSEGMKGLKKSPFHKTRLSGMQEKIVSVKDALARRDFELLGIISEAEALEMHAVMITQQPALLYWTPGTLELMKAVHVWRSEGLPCFFTINTGQNIHILTLPEYVKKLEKNIQETGLAEKIIVNHPAKGAQILS